MFKVQHIVCKCGCKFNLPKNLTNTKNPIIKITAYGDVKLRIHSKTVGKGYELEIDINNKRINVYDISTPIKTYAICKIRNTDTIIDNIDIVKADIYEDIIYRIIHHNIRKLEKDINIDFNAKTVYILDNIKNIDIVKGNPHIIYILDRDCIDIDNLNVYKYSIVCNHYKITRPECIVKSNGKEFEFICPECGNIVMKVKRYEARSI